VGIIHSSTLKKLKAKQGNERGTDPVTGLETSIVDIQVEQGSYDSELGQVLSKALAGHSEVPRNANS
jgi:hypothetical protein